MHNNYVICVIVYIYTEHCSVGSTNLLTTITARMKKERKISTVAGRGH